MKKRSYSFKGQLDIGVLGVQLAKLVLRRYYPQIIDYADRKNMQLRGIDLLIPDLGYLEVKTDTHSARRFFFELSVGTKPGAVDRSCADWFCVIYPQERVIYLIPRPELQMWLRNNMPWIRRDCPDWIKHTNSVSEGRTWRATGVVVPVRRIMTDIRIEVIQWKEDDEQVRDAEWKEGK